MRHLIAVFLCLCVVFDAKAKVFEMQEFVLDNGLQIIVVPNHKSPIIKHMVWYKVGSVDEPLGKSGKAHLLEHLMFRGTKLVKDSEFSRIIDENGGDSNAFTSYDYTSYHQTLDISRLELAMFLEADRMQNMSFSKESFAKERDIVFQERKQVVENNPAGYFNEILRANLWARHPYGRPVIGTDEEIKSFNFDEVMAFYGSFYGPNNAILVLSGDISVDDAKKLAEKYYGVVGSKTLKERPAIEPIDRPFTSKLEMALPNISSPRIMKMYVAPSYNTDKSKIYALEIFAKYLGDGDNSALYKDLVIKKKTALGVSASYDGFARSYGTFSLSLSPQFGVDTNVALKQLEDSVKNALKKMTAADVENAKKKMVAGMVYMRDNPSDAAYIIGSLAAVGMKVSEIADYDENIRKTSFEEVKKAAEDLFANSQNITGILTPKTGAVR